MFGMILTTNSFRFPLRHSPTGLSDVSRFLLCVSSGVHKAPAFPQLMGGGFVQSPTIRRGMFRIGFCSSDGKQYCGFLLRELGVLGPLADCLRYKCNTHV